MALDGVVDAGISSSPQPPLPDHHTGWVDVDPTISLDEYVTALEQTLDYPEVSWSVGSPDEFWVSIYDTTDPADISGAAAVALATAAVPGVEHAGVMLVEDEYSEATSSMQVAWNREASELPVLLAELASLPKQLPGAGVDIEAPTSQLIVAPYSTAPGAALEAIGEIATITAVDGYYSDGDRGMTVTVASDAAVTHAQELVSARSSDWGTITILGPGDDVDVAPGDAQAAAAVATARAIADMPGGYAASVDFRTVYVDGIGLEDAAFIDEHLREDAHYRAAAVTWVFDARETLRSSHKPAGAAWTVAPLEQAATLNGVEEVRSAATPGKKAAGTTTHVIAVRPDADALATELRACSFETMSPARINITVRDDLGELVALVTGALDSAGDLVTVTMAKGDGAQAFVDAWNSTP